MGVIHNSSNNRQDDNEKKLIDQLLLNAKLYTASQQYTELLDFVIRLRNFAPFNSMLLHIQKPGMQYAATAADWWNRYDRKPNKDARPLIILWPFAPVALVYDVDDTEGRELPEGVNPFPAKGEIDSKQISIFKRKLDRNNIEFRFIDAGSGKAGSICITDVYEPEDGEKIISYAITTNKNHSPPQQFATLAHELGHLFLGHQGENKKLRVTKRENLSQAQMELEAESVSYIACKRQGIESDPRQYLCEFMNKDANVVKPLDPYQIMRAAGHVENILGLTHPIQFKYRHNDDLLLNHPLDKQKKGNTKNDWK